MAVAVVTLRAQGVHELEQLLDSEAADFPARHWLRWALERPAKLLAHGESDFAWGLLPLLVYQAAGGEHHVAGARLAAAVECLVAATDIFDDLQDDDSPEALSRLCGTPTASNVAANLLCLAQLALLRLTEVGTPGALAIHVATVLNRALTTASAGQQRDLDQNDALFSEQGYLEMVAAKSGALIGGICHAAALLALAPEQRVAAYAAFGRHVGMAMQLGNDVAAVATRRDTRNDVRLMKRTLPLVFALENAPAVVEPIVSRAREKNGRARQLSSRAADQLRRALQNSGGVLYASVVAHVYWEHAREALDAAGCPSDSPLRSLVSTAAQ